MTSVYLSVDSLREIFRSLLEWRSVYESDGVDTLTNEGFTYSLWDIEYLYSASQIILPIRQRQAIDLCLVYNLHEAEAAQRMGIDPDNPVGMYATAGLESLLHAQKFGTLPSREYIFSKVRERYRENEAGLTAAVTMGAKHVISDDIQPLYFGGAST